MKKLIIAFILSSSCACNAYKTMHFETGNFIGKPRQSGQTETSLSIKPDNTFELFWDNYNYYGRWYKAKYKYLVLEFDRSDPEIFLVPYTIIDKDRLIYFQTKNRVKMYNLFELNMKLKRVKSR